MEPLYAVAVSDIMTTQIEMVAMSMPIHQAAKLLLERHVAGMPVTDPEGAVVGVISWSDLLRAIEHELPAHVDDFYNGSAQYAVGHLFPSMDDVVGYVGDYMSRRLIAVSVDASVYEASRIMTKGNVHRVLVMDDADNLAGIVSASDIVRFVAENCAKI